MEGHVVICLKGEKVVLNKTTSSSPSAPLVLPPRLPVGSILARLGVAPCASRRLSEILALAFCPISHHGLGPAAAGRAGPARRVPGAPGPSPGAGRGAWLPCAWGRARWGRATLVPGVCPHLCGEAWGHGGLPAAADRSGGCGSWGSLGSGSRTFAETAGEPGRHVHHNFPPFRKPLPVPSRWSWCCSPPGSSEPEALEKGG